MVKYGEITFGHHFSPGFHGELNQKNILNHYVFIILIIISMDRFFRGKLLRKPMGFFASKPKGGVSAPGWHRGRPRCESDTWKFQCWTGLLRRFSDPIDRNTPNFSYSYISY